ncbi:hypothetical protein [Nocardiopsis sp. NPDC006832]|uniref:hypothetical protein n=1 Tax=Nocardiopsis sp. NPDC006832 TaxID=3157188 RepID=UPI0033F1CFC9
MRPWQWLANVPDLAVLIVVSTALTTHFIQDQVTVPMGLWTAVLLVFFAGTAYFVGLMETTPSERQRAKGSNPLAGMALVNLFLSVGGLPFAGFLIMWTRQWALLPILLVGLAGLVLSFVFWKRERCALPEPLPEPTPKLVGMPVDARLPDGWIPVYVHRPGGRYRDMLVDYRLYVDGARVGELGPGRTLLIGLTTGAHVFQGRMTGGSSPLLSLFLSEGRPVHLVLEPNGSDLEALARVFTPGAYLRLAHRERPVAGFENGARGSNS